jgi:hypothetical protein
MRTSTISGSDPVPGAGWVTRTSHTPGSVPGVAATGSGRRWWLQWRRWCWSCRRCSCAFPRLVVSCQRHRCWCTGRIRSGCYSSCPGIPRWQDVRREPSAVAGTPWRAYTASGLGTAVRVATGVVLASAALWVAVVVAGSADQVAAGSPRTGGRVAKSGRLGAPRNAHRGAGRRRPSRLRIGGPDRPGQLQHRSHFQRRVRACRHRRLPGRLLPSRTRLDPAQAGAEHDRLEGWSQWDLSTLCRPAAGSAGGFNAVQNSSPIRLRARVLSRFDP